MKNLLDLFRSYKTLEKAKLNFIAARQRNLSPSTIESYEKTLKPFVAALGSERNVRRIDLGDLLEYASVHLYRDELSPRTINRRVKEIQAFFTWMVKVGYIDHSPASHLELVKVPDEDNAEKPIPYDHLQALLDSFYHSRLRQDVCRYAMLVFMADTGCRIGGVATLEMSKLKLKERYAMIHHKGAKLDKVSFGEECAHALNEWLLKRGQRDHEYVFCHAKGAYRPNNISQFIRRACRELNLPDYSGHRFRYSLAQRMDALNIEDEEIAAALGDTLEVVRKHYLATRKGTEANLNVAIPLRAERKIRMIK
jgi:site-specific recombinase XerD